MNRLQLFYCLIRADFLERTRRYSFLITLGFTLYAAYVFLPPNPSNYATLQLDGHRGIYNSAWVGSLVAMMTTMFLSFAGFYLVKNSLARDRQTRVGEILAATSLTRPQYLIGKALSNFAVLCVMIFLMITAAGVMQLIRGEDTHLQLWMLTVPFFLITLPVMAIVAALAVLFESIKFLRGGLGNVLFFFLWIFAVSSEALNHEMFLGINIPLKSMQASAESLYPEYQTKREKMSMGFSFKDEGQQWHLTTYEWHGVDWTAEDIVGRMLWFGVAFGIVLAAGLFFDRFDSTQNQPRGEPRRHGGWVRSFRDKNDSSHMYPEVSETNGTKTVAVHLSPLSEMRFKSQFFQMVIVELKVMLKGLSRWWYLVAFGLIIASLAVPLDVSRQILLPLAWVWPILLWSAMGVRETQYRTHQLIFSAAYSLKRQLPAMWLTGVIIAMLVGSGVAIRLTIAGEWGGMFAWCVGAMFIPSLALAMGVWTGSSKLFEVIYLLLWYVGPMNKILALDYLGSSPETIAAGIPQIYLVLTLVLCCLAVIGRRRQLTI
ncbi:MAG: ABC transporter permease [Ignavibacteria bacterium]|nr:ABC transporter permease [Ignavibacteria bacterium]